MNFGHLIIKTLLLIIASIVVGVFIPGIINYNNNNFSKTDVFNRLDHDKQKIILDNNYREEALKWRKQGLLSPIFDTVRPTSSEQISEIAQSLESLEKIHDVIRDKSIKLQAFYPKSKILLIWPFLYFGLTVLIFLIKPKYLIKNDRKLFITIFLLLLIFMRWPTWMRNTHVGKLDRVVYSVANYDISPAGFFIQEMQAAISILLMTIVICKWLSYSGGLRSKLLKNTSFSELYFLKVIRELRSIYQEWQLCSLLLALSFGYYTYYFWATIRETQDFRFLPHAIIVHVVWGLLWFIISLPLITIKNYHINFKEGFLRQQISPTLMPNAKSDTLNLILSEDPISAQNKAITGLITGATFLLPIFKTFF